MLVKSRQKPRMSDSAIAASTQSFASNDILGPMIDWLGNDGLHCSLAEEVATTASDVALAFLVETVSAV